MNEKKYATFLNLFKFLLKYKIMIVLPEYIVQTTLFNNII